MFSSGKRHNLTKRTKMKRAAKGPVIMSKQDTKIVKKYMIQKFDEVNKSKNRICH